jgi:hypothetical protein
VQLYVDGKPVGAAAYMQSLPLEKQCAGRRRGRAADGSFASRFPGRIDELASTTRVLSSADLAALAAGAQPPSR